MTAVSAWLDEVREERFGIEPFTFRLLAPNRSGGGSPMARPFDAVVEMVWNRRKWRFGALVKGVATPKSMDEAAADVKRAAGSAKLNPLIVATYLSPGIVASLERAGVSGVDRCGNGVVVVPGELLVVRTGKPNRFPVPRQLRNVYRGASSIVGRAFLARPGFDAVGDVWSEIRTRGGDVSLPTVSKAIKVMEQDLIVGRDRRAVRLLQPDRLLDLLATHYRPPEVELNYVGRVDVSPTYLEQSLSSAAERVGSRFAVTGVASAARYAVFAREPVVAAYCTRPPAELVAALPVPADPASRFPNLNLTCTADPTVYFDPTIDADVPYASPVQAYVELMAGGKRERAAAEQVRAFVLRRVGSSRGPA